MANTSGSGGVRPLYSAGEDLTPDTSSYILRGENRTVIVDPGPDWHVEKHLETISKAVDPHSWLFALILSPDPGCFSGLRVLAKISRRRAVVVHWLTAGGSDSILRDWQIRSPLDEGGAVPLGPQSRLAVMPAIRGGRPGAMIAFHNQTRTLFSGTFFGSMGEGRKTGRPVLRRESVRAYTDVVTPGLRPDLVDATFGERFEISQIAPAHGRLAVGGHRLIETLFSAGLPTSVPAAFQMLFLRLAALLSEAAAGAVFQAAGVPVPDLEEGYADDRSFEKAPALWTALLGRMGEWLSGSAISAVRATIGRLAPAAELPLPDGFAVLPETIPSAAGPNPVEYSREPADLGHSFAERQLSDDLTDSITGLPNEAAFRRDLTGELDGHAAESVSLLLIGVDNIERINNRFGRSGGDDALHTISYLLRNYRSARAEDERQRAYKLSGPSFAYTLRGGTLDDATGIAEELRKTISESAMFLEQITVSIGVVASDEPEIRSISTGASVLDTLLGAAAHRLRAARAGGKNTVCATTPEGGTALGTGASILIADPDAPYLETLTRQLNERGYTVLVADDGEDALEIISQIVPDVIVCEAMLPKLNGFMIRERLRHSSRLNEIPFILISHRKTDELVEKASLLGIVHFLRKPFSLIELNGLLRNLSGGYAE